MGYAKKYYPYFLSTFTITLVYGAVVITIPVLLGNLIDTAQKLLSNPDSDFNFVSSFSLIILFLFLRYTMNVAVSRLSARFSSNVSKEIRQDVFSAIQSQSHKFFDEENTGDLIERSGGDIAAALNFFVLSSRQTSRVDIIKPRN